MSSFHEDYIDRMIRQLVEALAAIFKLGKVEKADEAIELIQQTSLSLFGMEYRTLIHIDAVSVVKLLGRPEKIRALATLMGAEAELLQQRGDVAGAAHRLGHAIALLEEARATGSTPDAQTEALLRTLEARRRPLPPRR